MKTEQIIQDNYNYPKLNKLNKLFTNKIKNIDFSKKIIVACQHILSPQKEMFLQLIKIGFLPKNIFLLGKIYSTNLKVLEELGKTGISVTQPKIKKNMSFDIQHYENCKKLIKKAGIHRKKIDTIIVLDDGGTLLDLFRIEHRKIDKNIIGIEQTSSGFRKLEYKKIGFPIYNVARSKIKLELETPYIVSLGIKRIKEVFNNYKIKAPRILVVGLGPIGLELKNRLEKKYFVIGYDKMHGKKNISQIITNNKIDVIIGTTGTQILTHGEIISLNKKIDKKLFCISMSSSDREFELWKLRDLFKSTNNIHEDVLSDKIIVINNGFPITFKGNYFESTPKQMERTISLLFSGIALSLLEKQRSGFIDFPENVLSLIK